MKSLCKTPPQCDARLARRAFRKVVASLVSAALFAALLFAVSVAVSQPAAGAIRGNWVGGFTLAPGGSRTVNVPLTSSLNGVHVHCLVSVPSTSRFTVSANDCRVTVTAKATASNGCEDLAVSANERSTGHGYNSPISDMGTWRLCARTSDIEFTAPSPAPTIRAGRSATINVGAYASDGGFTITCGTITESSALISLGTQNGCNIPITAGSTAGNATISIPYTSSGGDTHTGTVTVSVRTSLIVYNPPSRWNIQTGASQTLSMDAHANDGRHTISCGTVTTSNNLATISYVNSGHSCELTLIAGSTPGTVILTIPFTSSGGDTITGTRTITIIQASNITFTAPSGLKVGTNRTQTINALDYVTEDNSDFTITCGDATSIDTTELMSVSRSGCVFTVTPKAVQGAASFVVPYTSTGGDTENGTISIEVGPESTVAYTAPGTLSVGRNQTLAIDALGYVTEDPAYTVTCGDATGVDANKMAVTHTGSSCDFTIDPVDTLAPANQGDTTFTIPYTSGGGHSAMGTVTVNIGPDSNLSFTAPPALTVGRNYTLVIDALENVSENTGHTVTCADPTGVDATKMTVTRSASGDGCSFTVDPVDTLTPANQGDTTFSVLFTTTGGTTTTGTFTINIGADSNIVFSDPGTLTVGRNRTRTFDASSSATDGSYTISCGDATGADATKMTVTRAANSCSFTIDPVDTLTPANQGDTTFSVPFTSTGGATATGTFTVNIGPDSSLSFTAPSTQTVGRNRTLVIDALAAISGENAAYTVSCADATGVDANRMTVTRSSSGNGCSFTVDPENALAPGNQGETTFSVEFTSTGSATVTGTFTINIGTDSIIAYTAPADLRIEAGSRTLEIDAGGFAADGSYALTCSDASALTSNLASVAHTGSSCSFTATTSSGTASGSASFTITYTSAGGDARQAVVPVRVGPARNLVFTAPSALGIGAGGTLVFDVSSYATDGGFWGVTCGDSTANTARIASVARVGDTCEFRVTAGSSLGAASFTVPYTSETGAMVSGVVPVVVGAAANIVFTAPVAGFPTGLNVEATKSIVIDASAYAADGSYAISCGDAESVSSLWQSVVRDSGGNGCSFTATARAGAGGTAGFTVPYGSSRGGSADGVISVLIRPLSDIVFTAPPTTGAGSLSVLAGRVLVLDASSYAADGDYAISCGAIAESSALISLGTQSGCVVPVTAVSGAGTAAISVPYTSSGGDTHTGMISLSVSRAVSGTAIPLLSNAGCTDGTFVNLTTNPRVTGANNDLAEDCMTLVAIQNHFAGFEANRDLAEFHAFREWGDASVEWGTGTASDRLVQNWIGITVTGGRVTDFVISATRSTVGGQFTIVSGTLPSEIQNLTALERLEADDHMLSGNIPSWLGSMSALNDVNLSDNNFSGPIPSELGNLSSLQFLNLSGNELSGSIPSQLGSLSNLRQLNLNSNQLTGSIPSQLGSLSSTAFTHLNLSGNRLSGSIPSQLTSLTALRNLLLDNNLLTGSIPSGIGSLTSLVTLDLEGNRLSGSVPAGVGSLSSLFRLDLSNNQFTGAIPAAVGNLVTLNPAGNRFTGVRQVYICGNYFTGALPTGLQQTASSQYVLQDYPIAEGFNPVACQDAMAVPASGDIVFAPPVVVPVQAGGESVYVNAASYFTGSDYAATCADATGPAIDDSKLTITRSGCSYNITAPAPSPVSRAFENVTFNVPYTQVSAGAAQVNGVVTVRILPASSIAFNAPSNLFVSASSTVVVDASGAASDGPYAISCGDATGVDSTKFSSVVRSTSGNGCMFTIASTASTGDGTFTVPFSSSGGATGTGTFTVNVNNIVYTAPTDLSVAAGRSIEITASSYVTDGANTFTCADATGIDSAKITSVVQVTPPGGCVFRVTTAAAAAGENVVITVPVTSSGGATRSIVIPMSVTPVSDIVFTAPAAVKIGAGNTKTIDVGAYAADGSYTISCGFQQSTRHARLASVAVSGCRFTLAAGSAQGAATLVVDYTSSGGDTLSGTVNLSIGPPSSVSFTAPAVPAVGRNRTLVINALDYVRENTAYAVSCSDAFDISTLPNIGFGLIRYRMSVARSTSGDGCAFTVDPLNTLPSNRWGNAIFRVVFTSEGGSSTTGTFTVNIRGDVAILFTDPGALAVPRNRILRIDATDHVEDGANTITCADATGFDSDKMAVTRRGCVYTVNPVNSLAANLLGETTFSAMFTSSGGSSTTGTFTVDIGPDTNIRTTNIPGTLFFTNSVKVNLSRFATDGDYEIFCTSVSATTGTISNRAANSCVFDYSPSFLGRFNVSFRSAGGSTTTASINVAQSLGTYLRSFSFPAQSVAAGRTIEIEASRHISLSTPNTYFCFEPTNVDGKITVVLRGCRYIITAGNRQGAASFNVNFSITSGEVRSAAVAVNVGPASDITFNAPTGLQVGRNRTLAIDATDYATDSSYTITCGDATGVDSTKLTSVSQVTPPGGCVFTVDPIDSLAAGSQGDTSFTVPFTSSGGDTATGAFTVNIGPDSAITYTAPGALEIGRNFTFEIDASDYVSEISGNGYTIACSDAAGVDANRMAVTRTANTCEYTVAPVGNSEANAADRLAPALQGDTTFAITFASTGGHTITRTLTINIGPDSVPMFTAPATNPAVGASLTRAVDVSSYATDGNYTISCGTITETDADITLGTQTGCSVLITSVATTPQTADITIPYTSSGGGSTTGTLTLDVGVASNIVFNAPTGLKVGINRTQTIDASDYAADGGNTISCGTATNVDTARLASVVRDSSGNGCGFTITPISTLTPAQQGTANFTVPYTSSGGDTQNGVIPIEVGPASNIVYTSPGTLSVARNLTLEIDASGYAADGSYTISCGDATGVTSTRLAVTHTGSSCDFTIDPVDALAPNLQGDTTFTIPFTSDGGATGTGTVTVNIGPDSALTFTAPGTFTLGRNRTLVIDALDAISGENAAYTVSCADATGVDATRMTVTRSTSGDRCSFTVDPVDTLAVGSQGDTTFSVAFSSTGGATASGTFTVNIGPDSTITANIPPATGAGRLQVARNLTLEIDASDYVSETSGSGYTISCSDARSIHSRLSSVSRTANTCDYTIDPVNSATSGTATFVVTFTSTGGHSIVRTITVNVGANSAITFTAPPTSGANRLLVGRNRSLVVDAGSYARETSGSGYTISCGDAVSIDTARLASVTHTGSSCSFTVTPVSSLSSSLQATNATFTVPYASSGGATADGIISVKVGPDSTITFNAPTLARGSNLRTFTIDASDYVAETAGSGYTISCGTATSVDTTEITSVTRLSNSCRYRIVLNGTQGSTGFTVPYTSTGGHAISRAIQITVGPASAIVFSAPASNPAVAASRTLTLDVGSYAADGSYTISCGTITESSALISLGNQTQGSCSIPIIAGTSTGTAAISVPYISSGGATLTRSVSIDVGGASNISFTAPSDLKVGINRTQTINALDYASDSGYTITCGTATSIDSTRLTSVVRDSSGNGCGYTITPISTLTQSQQGAASFTVPLTSDGGDTENAVFSIAVGPASTITFTAPSALLVPKNRTLVVDAAPYAVEANPTNYAISCGDATSIDTVELQSVTRTANTCTFTITPKNVTGSASFTVPYTSEGGHSVDGAIPVTVGTDSTITYSSPGTLTVGRNRTLTIDASGYVEEIASSGHTITCSDAAGVDNTRLTSVTRTANTCSFTITPVSSLSQALQGDTTFSITFTSSGGHSITRTITVNVGPDSALTFTAPSTFTLGRNRTLVIDALDAISGENADYTVNCADATGVDATKMTVTRSSSGDGCSFTVDPVDTLAVGSQGDTTFSVAFTSTGGATASGTFTVNIGPDSTITTNIPPATGANRLLIGRNLTLTIDASDYVAEETGSGYTISCSDARNLTGGRLTSVTRTANTCSYTIDPNNSASSGAATFTVTFTSTGGHSVVRVITVNVGPNSAITFNAPPTSGANRLTTGRNRALVVNAASYARETSGSGYTITCGDATGIDTARLASVTHTGSSCSFTVTPVSTLSSSLQATNAAFTVPYSSSGGATANGTISVKVGPDSTITYNAPTLERGNNLRTFTIDASDYVSEVTGSGWTISCGTATSVDTTEITSVTRLSNSCRYRIVLNGTQGTTSFTVPYTSTGGHAISRAVQITVGAASSIVFSAPASNPAVAASRTRTIDVGSYATDGSYTISCGTISEFSALISLGAQTQGSCSIPITAGTGTGTAFISVPYISSGGARSTRSVSIDVGVASNISFTAPSDLKVGINRTQTINALDYASDSGYTITCGTATSVDSTKLTSVARDSSGNGCGYTITPISTLTQSQQGAASFTVPLTSDGGDTENAMFSIAVGPASTITFTAPSALLVPKNRTLVVDAAPYAVEANPTNYAISCGDATSIDTVELQSVTRAGNTCTFTITPKNVTGSASFTVPYTSEGGHSVAGAIPVTVGTDSTITFTSPGTLTVGRNRTLTIDASDYVEEIASSGHTITCSDASGVDNTRLTSVTRTANTCSFTITPITTLTPAQQGNATFRITFTSSGGHEITRTITVRVGPDSTIVFAAPASNPAIAANRTRTIDVSSYASDGSYTISCGTITGSDPDITLGAQTGCSIAITAGPTANQTADISIPYSSSGGHSITSTLTLDVGAASRIVFNAPTGLAVGTNRTQTINALDYATDGGYTITCGTATNTGANEPTTGTVALASVVRDSGCGYTIRPTSAQGTATFTIPYTSAGGDTANGNISITVGAASNIRYISPGTLRVGRNQTLEIDASGYASDGSYAITCADATGVDNTKLTSVSRTANSCDFTIDPVDALAPANQGTTTFSIAFTSAGGHSITRSIAVNIGPDSNLTFTAPSTFTLGRNRTLVIDALAAISGENAVYTVSCADATGVDANKMTVTRSSSGNRCSFTVDPVDTLVVGSQGDATFAVAFASTGGATASGTFTVNIGPDSTITANIPPATGANRLQVARNLTLEIDASDYVSEASPTNYTISCSDARSVHSRLTSVARTANTCRYTIDPNNFAFPGAATFVVTFTSTGGHSIDRTITVNVGANSVITFTAPPTTGANRLLVGRNRALVVNAGSYARETIGSGYTISCGDATGIDSTRLASVTHSGSSCSFTVTPVSSLSSSLQATNATFTVPYSSTGGATANGTISVKVGPDSTITYNAPTLERGSNLRTFTIDASDYVSETTGSGYTISCGTATSVDTTEITSVTRLSNSCRYRIVLNGTQGTTSFTVPYTSTGGHAISRAVQITVGPASSIVFTAPSSNPAVAASRTLTLDVSSYATDGSYTISCGTISEFSALISLGAQTGCSIPITAATSTGTAFISVPYISSGGATTTRSISIDVGVASDIQFSAPSDLKVGINRTQTINALDYATDSGYTITCGTATSVDSTKLTSVVRDASGNGCGYTITPISTLTQSQQGSASFTVPLTSDGGDTENAVFSIAVGPASTITFTPPSPALSVAKNRTITVDVSGYAVEANPTNYAISCGDATSIDTVELQSVTHTGSSCTFTINPKNVTGSASFTVPYTSEGGHSVAGAISVTVGPDSNIVYTAPTGLRVGRNRTLVIDATDHFTEDNTYTVTCGDATGIDNTRLTSVARTANTCTFTVDPVDALAVGLQGNTTFSVPLSSTGGHTRSALFTVNVGPDSNIVFAAPTGLKVGRNRTLAINALAAVTENGVYTVTCADATGVDANRMTVTRSSTGSRCVFTVDPVDTLATGLQGNTTFAVAFTSTGGATASGTFTVNIGPDSTITYNAPTGLLVGRNRTLTIDASGYVSESDSNNTITCGDATAIHSRLTSVARTANSCSYTIDPNNFATPGTATFSIAFTSDGGHTRTETISVEIGPNSTIRFTAPPTFGPNRLRIGRNLTLAIDALDYANENAAYTVTCGDATGVDAARLTVTHTGSSCDFTIDPVDTLAQSLQGNTSFTIPYTSNGGATATGRITVNIGPDSAITFTPPTGLKIGRNRTLAIDALAAISGENAAYTVSCADATGVDATKMTVTRSSSGNRCSFTVDPVNSLTPANQGDTTFAVAFSSTGGATASGTFTVNIGPDSTIAYTAPTGLLVGRNRTLTVDVSSAATDGSYTVTCGDATNVHSRFSSVTRPDAQASPCVFAAAPRTTASLGTASFVVPFISDGGAASTGTVSITISQPSAIVFTAPDPALQIAINRTRVIDALDYARDGNYTITCLDATGVDSTKLTSVTRSSSGNGCGYTINPISSLTQSQQGDATFTVPYRSAGGHVLNQVFTITVGPASTIVYTAPVGANALTVGHNRTLTIDASSYAADGSYAISCGDARSIHARIDHITRQGCSFTITPVSGMTGAATFTVPYSSAGGHTTDGQVSVAIGAASNIVYSAPSGIVIPASTARTIDVGSYAADGSYAISCGDATGVNASRLASVTHTGTSCSFEITATASQGATSFVVPYRSAGGATLSGTISLSVGPASSIVFTAPSGLDVHVGETLLVHANDYASDGPYSLQCADATNRSASLASVVRAANTCDFTITPGSSTGTGSFNVAYTSSGGATHTGTISVNISPQSTIAFTAPTGLSVAAGRSVTVDASSAADTGYTVSCGAATAINARIARVSRTGCSYVVTAGSIAGSASFTIPFTSTGGATLNAQIAITIGPRSSIAFAAPTGLSVQIGSTLTIDASDYAADSTYAITCGDATGISTALASVARTANTCNFTITPGTSTGSGSFTVPYSSSGGATRNGSITVAVTPESSIVFAPPPTSGPNRLRIGAGNTRTINLASYASDGPYSITCGNATAAEPAKLTDIHRNACRYTITAAAAAAQGDTTFTLTYTSSGGNTSNASFTINIGPASNIVYAAPADITLQASSARGIDLSSYAADGTGNDAYTIGCLDATGIDPEISSVARNGCVYTIRAGSTPGEADFHITYTSTGGDTHLATVHITITPAPREPDQEPAGPIQPIDPPTRRPTPPPPTTTTTTTTADPSRPTTTLEPDQPGPRWNTLTAQQGGTTPGQIRQAFNLATGQAIYTWNTNTQTWTRATRSSQTIPAGTRVSFRTEEAVSNREMRTSNLGGDTTRMRLTAGWSTLSIPQGITRTDDTDFLLDPSLTDCRNQQGIIAIASFSTRSRRWSISLPCHPTAQRRLTTGQNAPYRPLMSIAPADTTYIYTRTRQPLTIRWNPDTQTYQVFQSIFTR